MMIRKHIFIPKAMNAEIKLMAKASQKSEAEVIRSMLEETLEKKAKKYNAGAMLLKLADMAVTSNDPNFSKNIDKYLYEDE